MSFLFNWPDEFPEIDEIKQIVEDALNKGSLPAIICDRIKVESLNFGNKPPDLDIMEIGELGLDRIRGLFKLCYSGNASITLTTMVQVNPLCVSHASIGLANAPLRVPLRLNLSDFRIRGIFALIASMERGLTLSFKNDPLQSLKISSSFDEIPLIREHIQSLLKTQIGELIRNELPLLVYEHSLQLLKTFTPLLPKGSHGENHVSSLGDTKKGTVNIYYAVGDGIIKRVSSPKQTINPFSFLPHGHEFQQNGLFDLALFADFVTFGQIFPFPKMILRVTEPRAYPPPKIYTFIGTEKNISPLDPLEFRLLPTSHQIQHLSDPQQSSTTTPFLHNPQFHNLRKRSKILKWKHLNPSPFLMNPADRRAGGQRCMVVHRSSHRKYTINKP